MFPVAVLNGPPSPDSMPVLKTTEYPWANGSYRPLCHARCAIIADVGVYFELIAFERDPLVCERLPDGSCTAVSFDFFPETDGGVLTALFGADGRFDCFLNGAPYALGLETETFAGEDEQGWYHGVRFYLPNEALFAIYGVSEISPGHKMKGNIYKFKRAGSDSHMGAVGPVSEDSIFSRRNLCDFIAVC